MPLAIEVFQTFMFAAHMLCERCSEHACNVHDNLKINGNCSKYGLQAVENRLFYARGGTTGSDM